MNGAFSPLEGFLGQQDYESVCEQMRLTSGVLWPMPITLDVTEEFAAQLSIGQFVALRDPEGVLLATIEVNDIWTPDLDAEAQRVYGTTDDSHPAVAYLKHQSNPVYLGGKVRGIEPPTYYDFKLLRDTPSELRGRFRKRRVSNPQSVAPCTSRAHLSCCSRVRRQLVDSSRCRNDQARGY